MEWVTNNSWIVFGPWLFNLVSVLRRWLVFSFVRYILRLSDCVSSLPRLILLPYVTQKVLVSPSLLISQTRTLVTHGSPSRLNFIRKSFLVLAGSVFFPSSSKIFLSPYSVHIRNSILSKTALSSYLRLSRSNLSWTPCSSSIQCDRQSFDHTKRILRQKGVFIFQVGFS